jgi:undecaprenyl-diphosphatase
MPLFALAILAVIQGITEFLPISSSGHLILFPTLTGEADQGLSIDVAVHIGTLLAVILFFRADVAAVLRGARDFATGRRETDDARLTFLLAIASIPVIVAGLAVAASGLNDLMRAEGVAAPLIAATTIVWGAALWAADKLAPTRRAFGDWRMRDAILMGLAQALALVPGTSRSGITITAARALGFGRVDSARLSMLMSIPAIAAAGGWLGVKLVLSGDLALGRAAALAAALALVSALLALWGLMRMLQSWTMTPFVLYRFALGAALIWIGYSS